jgi:hypothetical protein
MQFTQQVVTQHVIFWRHVMGTFLLTHVHFATNFNVNINFINNDNDQRLDYDHGGDSDNNNGNWGSSPRYYVFLSSLNMLTYAQGVARHNAGNWLEMRMRRLRRIAS